jgi:putative DNA primase/helicase
MTATSEAINQIIPDPALIETFSKVLFEYCDGWVAVREFPEKGNASQAPCTPFFRADKNLARNIASEAQRAATSGLALYVVAGTVSGPGKAKAGDVIAIETVLVDLDHGDVSAKREHLVKHLGPPSLEVASGKDKSASTSIGS